MMEDRVLTPPENEAFTQHLSSAVDGPQRRTIVQRGRTVGLMRALSAPLRLDVSTRRSLFFHRLSAVGMAARYTVRKPRPGAT